MLGHLDKSTLLEAIRRADVDAVLSLLDKQTDTDIDDPNGASLGHVAARTGNVRILAEIMRRFPDMIRSRSVIGATPLHDAAVTGNLECIQWLIQNAGSDPEDFDDNGNNVLHLAARYGHFNIVKWLIQDCEVNILSKNKSGAIALHFAVTRGNLEIVKYLVEQKPGTVNIQMKSGATAVYLAAQDGHLEILRYLVEEGGGSVKILAYDGMSCLHAAAQMGHLECVRWLVMNHGLKVNDKDFDGTTPLHLAASNGHVDVITWLLDNGALMLADALGGTPLHDAAEHGQLQSVRILIQRGCDPSKKDEDGLTAAKLAELCWQAECAALLRSRQPEEVISQYELSNYSDPIYEEQGELYSSSSSFKSAKDTYYCDSPRQSAVSSSRPPSVNSKGSQTNESIPPFSERQEYSVDDNEQVKANKYHTLPINATTAPPTTPPLPPPAPPPPPPPLPTNGTLAAETGWSKLRKITSHTANTVGGMTKSFSTNTISTSCPSRGKRNSHQMRESTSMDLIAELKAANGMASLKRTKLKQSGSSQYFGASRTRPGQGQSDGDGDKPSVGGNKLKTLVKILQGVNELRRDTKAKVKLREEFEPTNFLEQVPPDDKTGKPLPSWKRLLVARQLAERAQKEHDEKQKVKEEEDKYQGMPLWKRAILQKRHTINSAKSASVSVTPPSITDDNYGQNASLSS